MTTAEKNAEISLFMGKIKKIFKKDGSFDGVYCRMNGEIININSLKYHSDWNWLMLTIERVLDISLNLDSMEMYYEITDSIPDINKAHEAVYQFVVWHNQQ